MDIHRIRRLPFGNAFDWFPFYEKDQKLKIISWAGVP